MRSTFSGLAMDFVLAAVGAYGIEIDMRHDGQDGRVNLQPLALIATFPEPACAAVFEVCCSRDRLTERLHEVA